MSHPEIISVQRSVTLVARVRQAWMPTYMSQELGLDLKASAGLSAAPFAMMALCTQIAGRTSDKLLARGWRALSVRRLMILISSVVPAACLIALGFTKAAIPAVGLLMLALGAHSFSIAGFHAHIQDVAPSSSGKILGFTNTVGVLVGIVANLATGALLAKTGSFQAVFALTATIYLSSAAVFVGLIKGEPLM